ncbi:DUF302 domain-containing protein [Frateuria terrea]|uniref:Uncharacterized conserved protein, DUF302 family n=1 Tax=Frateuria terrea TaxID=529704 RepID=A0A1H6UUA2_9GAMM|nr:DUF302 domain-containing protein [Frateuria terrea]SEI94244.1 Uncharacterized conserved protein, DUF302 family [Frateuria terrea]SFP34175.1 Uncharacterized conserved protein, DUF302 family [Frateuria terrea]
MYYIVESRKTFAQAAEDLDAAVRRNGFGVLHVHDIGATLRSKGVPFERECKVFEICNPRQAAQVMQADMRLNMALPCRISVYTGGGQTSIGMIEPDHLLRMLSDDPVLQPIANEVETQMRRMIDEAR